MVPDSKNTVSEVTLRFPVFLGSEARPIFFLIGYALFSKTFLVGILSSGWGLGFVIWVCLGCALFFQKHFLLGSCLLAEALHLSSGFLLGVSPFFKNNSCWGLVFWLEPWIRNLSL